MSLTTLPPRILLTRRDAAAALAISERALWTLTARGEVPCVRLGRSVRYEPSVLAAFVAARRDAQSRPGEEVDHVL